LLFFRGIIILLGGRRSSLFREKTGLPKPLFLGGGLGELVALARVIPLRAIILTPSEEKLQDFVKMIS
jgi:hypothetical protein